MRSKRLHHVSLRAAGLAHRGFRPHRCLVRRAVSSNPFVGVEEIKLRMCRQATFGSFGEHFEPKSQQQVFEDLEIILDSFAVDV
jgi:hypothetical protein